MSSGDDAVFSLTHAPDFRLQGFGGGQRVTLNGIDYVVADANGAALRFSDMMPARFTSRITYLKLSFRPPLNEAESFRIRLIRAGDTNENRQLAEFVIANPLHGAKR